MFGGEGVRHRFFERKLKRPPFPVAFFIPPLVSGRSGTEVPMREYLSSALGGSETLWRDLGGGMGTHRASGEVKAKTGLKHEGQRL